MQLIVLYVKVVWEREPGVRSIRVQNHLLETHNIGGNYI